MRAMTYRGPYKVRMEEKERPTIEHPNDAIVRVQLAAICGSDLHLYHGMMPDTRIGHTFGHEFIGVVDEVGSSVQNLAGRRPGDGAVQHLLRHLLVLRARPVLQLPQRQPQRHGGRRHLRLLAHHAAATTAGRREYVRVPFADVGPSKIPDWMADEDAVLLTDVLATGYFGAQLGDIVEGDVVVVFGAGPVGLFAAKSAWLMGAGRVIVIDHLDYRLEKARTFAHAETLQLHPVRRHRRAR